MATLGQQHEQIELATDFRRSMHDYVGLLNDFAAKALRGEQVTDDDEQAALHAFSAAAHAGFRLVEAAHAASN